MISRAKRREHSGEKTCGFSKPLRDKRDLFAGEALPRERLETVRRPGKNLPCPLRSELPGANSALMRFAMEAINDGAA